MRERYLLYIDILGFSELVQGRTKKIADLYEVIASLNVHSHPSFRAIVFSDTILVYNVHAPNTSHDRSYLVMYLCEFAQDLQHRLTGKDIFFRAALVNGDFNHYELNGIPCFFGKALVGAYRAEKQIQAVGLFMENNIVVDSNIFPSMRFNDQFSFVFITQALTRLEEYYGGEFPTKAWLFDSTDETYLVAPEVLYLKKLSHFATRHPIAKVRKKHKTTLGILKKRYPQTIRFLEKHNFNPRKLAPGAEWGKALAQWPQDFGWAVKVRKEY
jgi:hypothetical protein